VTVVVQHIIGFVKALFLELQKSSCDRVQALESCAGRVNSGGYPQVW